jgi:hypothetical protein
MLNKIMNDFKKLLAIIILSFNRKLLYRLQYFHQRGKFPNLKQPKDLSEHVLSEMIKPSFAIKYANYADKIKVRQYVKEMGLEEILLKHYGIWDNANKIDFNELPDKFVLKTNNGCGGQIFCRDKSKLDIKKSILQLNKIINLPYYFNKEPQYKLINPLIFCEELIDTGSDNLPVDYKFFCIKGKPISVVVYSDRKVHKRRCMLDMDWNLQNGLKNNRMPETFPNKPKHFDKMKMIAKKLSKEFDFVRVDLYEEGNKLWFGELTFTPSGGLFRSLSDEAIRFMGSLY